MADWVAWDAIAWVAGTLGVGALVGWYFGETLKELLPTPRRVARWLRVWRGAVVPATGSQFAILIADLDGDTDGRQTRRVRDAFLGVRGLDVNAIGRKVALTDLGNLTEAQIEAEDQGRTLLERYDGDLLIWGQVQAADKELALWFLNRDGPSTLGAPSYTLTEKLTLPADFQEDLAVQLQAMALARLAPATEKQGRYLVDLLRRPAGKLERLLSHGTPRFGPERTAGLQFAYGNAAAVIGEQSGENSWLERSIRAFREALKERTRERVPLDWAGTQNNLGGALATLGQRESGTARLDEAVEAYGAALEVLRPAGLSHYAAIAERNLALAEALRAERRGVSAVE